MRRRFRTAFRTTAAGAISKPAASTQGRARPRAGGRFAAGTRACVVDLTVVSVLLDAGAGAAWARRTSGRRGGRCTRSGRPGRGQPAGLLEGALRPRPTRPAAPMRQRCCAPTRPCCAALFQAGPSNPLVGLEAAPVRWRDWDRLQGRSRARRRSPAGCCYDRLTAGGRRSHGESAGRTVLAKAAACWARSGPAAACPGVLAGDVAAPLRGWHLAAATTQHAGVVPFHKLSQWLSFRSLNRCNGPASRSPGSRADRPARSTATAACSTTPSCWCPAARRTWRRPGSRATSSSSSGARSPSPAGRTGPAGAAAHRLARPRREAAAGLCAGRRHLGGGTRDCRRAPTRWAAAGDDRQRRHGVLMAGADASSAAPTAPADWRRWPGLAGWWCRRRWLACGPPLAGCGRARRRPGRCCRRPCWHPLR